MVQVRKCYNVHMKLLSKMAILLLVFTFVSPAFSTPQTSKEAAEIVEKINKNYSKIKDATADITIDYNLHLLGCSGHKRVYGNGHYKAPERLQGTIDGDTYWVKGNDIRKSRRDGQKFYVRLINSLDFSVGLHPGLMTHNFYLKVIKKDKEEIVMEGIPKPGILKNAKKVMFYIDPQRYLLREIDVIFPNPFLGGRIKIEYEKIQGLWVPVGCHGESAIELRNSILIGYGFKLSSQNMNINTGLGDKLFEAGF